MVDLRAILGFPVAYRAFVRAFGGNYRERYIQDYVQVERGQRIVDLGCGPGDVLEYLPEVDYLGIDANARYIQAAHNRFGDRGHFLCESVSDIKVREPATCDIVMANGLLHHLTDSEAHQLVALARHVLKPGGRLVTFDGAYVPGQARIARILLRLDRGRHVRSPEGYLGLVADAFDKVEHHTLHDFLSIPYTHFIMVCRKALAS